MPRRRVTAMPCDTWQNEPRRHQSSWAGVVRDGFLQEVTSKSRPVPGKCMGRYSLSKGPSAQEHILTDSWNRHKYLLRSTVGEWGAGR